MSKPNDAGGSYRVNENINASTVRLVAEDGSAIGIVSLKDALNQANRAGLDLVEIAGQAKPPVCKLLNYGKFKYEAQKRKNEARKKQKVVQVKEVKLRPRIEEHDYQVKLRNATRFLEGGDKVKVTLMFRRRELDHKEIGIALMQRMQDDLGEIAKVDNVPKLERNQMHMMVSPKPVG